MPQPEAKDTKKGQPMPTDERLAALAFGHELAQEARH
jgi:hypothetical protein